MKNSKRLVTLLLAIVMLVGMFTVGASATEVTAPDLTVNFDASNVPGSGVGSYTTTVKAGGYYKLPGDDSIVWSGAGQLHAAGTVFSYDQLKALASTENVVGFVAFPNSTDNDDNQGNQGTVTPPTVTPGKKYNLKVDVYVSGYGYGYGYGYDYDYGYGSSYNCGCNGKYYCNNRYCKYYSYNNNNYYNCGCNGKYYCNNRYCKYYDSYKAPSYDWDDVFDPSWNPDEGPYRYNYNTNNKYYGNGYYTNSYIGFYATGSGSYAAGETVSLRAKAPSNVNCRFVGWYNVNKKFSSSKSTTFTMPAADTTVYAVFQVMGYNDNYYNNTYCNKYHSHTIRYTDGVSSQVVFKDVVKTVKHGATTPTIADPVRPGYRFVGWTPKVARTATECVTYVAQWSTAQAPKLTNEHVAYLKGFGKGEFRPENKMTRAEYAVLLYRLLDAATVKAYYSTTNDFSDVKSDAWYNEAVSTLAAAGVIGSGSTFRPTEDITRAEMISMLANFYTRKTNYTCNYKDVPTNYWAYDEIAMAQYNGWIKGYGANTFLPEATITRAEVAAVMNRVLGRDTCKTQDTKKFSDNPTTAWFYQDVVEATIAH